MIESNGWTLWLMVCGIALHAYLCFKLGGMLARAGYAAVAGCSFVRFAWACGKVHGFRENRFSPWVYAPQIWLEFFLAELDISKGSLSHMGGSGVWNGIGNWTVFPVKEAEEC